MGFFPRKLENTREQDAVLLEASSRLREALGGLGGLSQDTRARILSGAVETTGRAEKTLKPVFVPAFRVAVAACVPIVLAAGLGALVLANRTVPGERQGALRASKVGDQVIFMIANGKRAHYVYRSADPGRFDASSGVRVEDGRFQDTAEGGPSLVFYRVD